MNIKAGLDKKVICLMILYLVVCAAGIVMNLRQWQCAGGQNGSGGIVYTVDRSRHLSALFFAYDDRGMDHRSCLCFFCFGDRQLFRWIRTSFF